MAFTADAPLARGRERDSAAQSHPLGARTMMRMPRFLPSLVIACATAAPMIPAGFARAQDAAAPAAAPAAAASAPIDPALKADVENFWHYGKIGKYDLSADAGNKILSGGKDPVDVLKAFEAVAED